MAQLVQLVVIPHFSNADEMQPETWEGQLSWNILME